MNKEEKIARELEKGETLIDLGYFDEGIVRLDSVLEMDPENVDALIFKGTALEQKDQLKDALACFDKSLEILPRNKIAWDYKGYVLYKMKDYSNAADCFRKAIEISNKYTNAYFNLACCYCLLKKKQETLETLKTLFQLSPGSKREAKSEPDLGWIKEDPEFIKLLSE